MRKRKAGIATAKNIAIKKLRGEKPGKLREENYDYSFDMTEDAKAGLKKSLKSQVYL